MSGATGATVPFPLELHIVVVTSRLKPAHPDYHPTAILCTQAACVAHHGPEAREIAKGILAPFLDPDLYSQIAIGANTQILKDGNTFEGPDGKRYRLHYTLEEL